MKLTASETFILRTVADVHLLVPLKEPAFDRRRILPLNETGVLLWNRLQRPATLDELAAELTSVYEIDQATALEDCRSYLASLQKIGACTTQP